MKLRDIDNIFKRGTIVGTREELEILSRALNKCISSTNDKQIVVKAALPNNNELQVIMEPK